MNLLLQVLIGAVRGGTSILFAALGETLSERAGVINLGIEGCMLVGALGAYAATAVTGNPWIGVLAGAGAGGLLALVHANLVLSRGANQLATGLVVLFLGLGITSLFGSAYVGRTINAFDPIAIPGLSDIPWLGDIFFNHDPLTYVAFAVGPAMWWLLFRSRWGLWCGRQGSAARCWPPTAGRRCASSTWPWSVAAPSPASAGPSWPPPMPTPGSRT